MKFKILTIFPQMIENALSESILGRARRAGAISAEALDIRAFSESKHKNTDDAPFGGGAGMVMTPQPLADCIKAACGDETSVRRIYLSPRGETFTQKKAEELSKLDSIVLLCGHYEGIDQRIIDSYIDEEISVGDYVLTGGELGALIITDAVARLVPGVLGSDESSVDESFSSGLLEYPQYTRPRDFEGSAVPDVLLGGNQKLIDRWRRDEAIKITLERRPEMLKSTPLDKYDRALVRQLSQRDKRLIFSDCRDDELLERLSEESGTDFSYTDDPESADCFIFNETCALPETSKPVCAAFPVPPAENVFSACPARFSPAVLEISGDEGIKSACLRGLNRREFADCAAALLPVKRALRYRADYGKNRSAYSAPGEERRLETEFFDGSRTVRKIPRLPQGYIRALAAFLTSGKSPISAGESQSAYNLYRLTEHKS